MKLKKMIARVFRALPTVPPGSIGENDIIDYLNEGLESIASMSTKTTALEYNLDANADSIPFPVDMMKLVNVLWENTELSESIIKTLPDTTGNPTNYWVEDGRIVFRPIPSTDGTVHIIYTKEPTELENDDDVPDIEGVSEYLVNYALYRIHLEANSPSYQVWETKRYESLAIFMETYDQNYQTPFRIIPMW